MATSTNKTGSMTHRMLVFDDKLVFENPHGGDSTLVFNRSSVDGNVEIEVVDGLPDTINKRDAKIVSVEAIFGIYQMLSGPYIAIVLESELKYTGAFGLDFRKASKVAIVPLFSHGRILNPDKQRDEDRYLALLRNTFESHNFYFSFTHDITHTMQRVATMTNADRNKPIWARAAPQFFWNRGVVTGLIEKGASDWIVPMMSAHLEVRPNVVMDGPKMEKANAECRKPFTLLFISRRSRQRQGCRFSKRGIDEHGNVANFVETEQVVLRQSGKASAFVQIRGSIPLRWSSPVTMKYAPKVYIEPNAEVNRAYFARHMDSLAHYVQNNGHTQGGQVIFVNLIDKKKDQGLLGKAFEDVSRQYSKGGGTATGAGAGAAGPVRLRYVWFDFHKECRKMRWFNLKKLVEMVDQDFKAQGFFACMATGEVTQLQEGVLRTNCMDNLDRTNVVQSLFARRFLLMQFDLRSDLDTSVSNVLETGYKSFESVFKDVWGNNADAISLLYAGTGALKTDFTRTGKRTKKGLLMDGWNSVVRYYMNNFVDGARQDGVDLLTGRYKPKFAAPSPFLPLPGGGSGGGGGKGGSGGGMAAVAGLRGGGGSGSSGRERDRDRDRDGSGLFKTPQLGGACTYPPQETAVSLLLKVFTMNALVFLLLMAVAYFTGYDATARLESGAHRGGGLFRRLLPLGGHRTGPTGAATASAAAASSSLSWLGTLLFGGGAVGASSSPDTVLFCLEIAVAVTTLVVVGTVYVLFKKGGNLGRRLVVHPALCPEM